MPQATVAAFFKQVARDANLQQALVEFAARRGFPFSVGELHDVMQSLAGAIEESATTPSESPEDRDNDVVDPGFGIIEYPA